MLHALVGMTSAGCKLQPTHPAISELDGEEEEEEEEDAMPVTSYLCQWKVPKKRKESTLQMSSATFQKHDYHHQGKRKVAFTEDFDPRPSDCRGIASSLLPTLLECVRGESLGVSLLFDEHYRHQTIPLSVPHLPDLEALKDNVAAFKESMKTDADKIREIERSTREQRHSTLWFAVRRFRITASRFGEVLRRKPDTPPDSLVLSILQPRSFASAATDWGIQNESVAIQTYVSYQHQQGLNGLTVGPCGFMTNEAHPFLGATPDGTVYDPSNHEHPFGFIEVKCPYSHRESTPLQASSSPGFFCTIVEGVPKLRLTHPYYAQIQGQMAIGGRVWCDFVVFTTKGISVERVEFDDSYWQNTLLPKLETFFDDCLGPEIVSPLHPLGLKIRDLSKIK